MDPLERFFRVVPQNVPRDDLRDYLRLYADEAAGMSVSPRAPTHSEWYVNTRLPRMRSANFGAVSVGRLEALRALGVVGQPLGPDPTDIRNTQAGLDLVSATWAQRAANAFLSMHGAALIQVDGIVGPQTITALRWVMLRYFADESHESMQPDTGQTTIASMPMPTRSGTGVSMAQELYESLVGLTQVADPPRTSAPRPPTPPATSPLPVQPPASPPVAPPVDATPVVAAAASGAATAIGIGILAVLGLGYALTRR